MKKLMLVAAAALVLSACSNSGKNEKQIMTRSDLVGTWVCAMKYDDLNFATLDVSEFKENGQVNVIGDMIDKNFDPVKFTYKVEDQGRWELKGNQLVLDYDRAQRKVTKTTPKKALELLKKKEYKALADYEQGIFNILSNKDMKESAQITLDILRFNDGRIAIQQDMGDTVYTGGCVTKAKAEVYLKDVLK